MSTAKIHREEHREMFFYGCWYCDQMKKDGRAPAAVMEKLWDMPIDEIKRRMKAMEKIEKEKKGEVYD